MSAFIVTLSWNVAAPSALNVPAVVVLPLDAVTWNLLVLTLKSLVTSAVPVIVTFPPNSALPVVV